MNPRQLEIWALNVIDLVKSGNYQEDDLVELKTVLPEDNFKIARRIAGHANAARGENILWLIGIDEKSEINKIKGINNDIDLANWYPSVQKHFIELSPKLTTVNVPIDDKIILALGFETDRSPFVVKNQKDTNFNEVPWREGTRVRSARRSDLILLLSPIEKLPDVEIVSKKFEICPGSMQINRTVSLNCELQLYINPKNMTIFSIPFHRCEAIISVSTRNIDQNILCNELNIVAFGGSVLPPKALGGGVYRANSKNLMMEHTTNEIIIRGPGMVTLSAFSSISEEEIIDNSKVNIEVKLYTTISERPIILKTNIPPDTIN
ncbi:hypothetical protein VB715_15120 [Crocosphaera sp. UHCC 0190]|uniref:hypothetical protein n=1 Tax=Crocosphaera sp. UHCC 0190 TaxID=3110246 RepID=UPI002B1EC3E0|nr:hypothetical protein [Crocosphaera sp. UHCC 0190]MEA5511104.1 hypothetical protein [Crocosphaera sp. UHCC 0190]